MQVEVVAAARRHGVIAYPVAKRLDALYREVTAGRPVLVLQDLALAGASVWHYAIVIGFDRSTNEVILRSGSQRRLVMNRRAFERSWRRGDHWAVVMLKQARCLRRSKNSDTSRRSPTGTSWPVEAAQRDGRLRWSFGR